METPTQTSTEISPSDHARDTAPRDFIAKGTRSFYARLALEKPHYYHYTKSLNTKKRLALKEVLVFAGLLMLAALVMSGLG